MSETPLGFLLVDAARLYRLRIDRAFEQAGLGLTAGEARTLAYVNQHPGLRQNALAVEMNVEPMTLVGFLDRLEARGLLFRELDPTDRRAKIVRLTDEGRPLVEQVLAAGSATREQALAGVAEADRVVFRAVLQQLRSNLCATSRSDES